MTITCYEADVRAGGSYRFVMEHPSSDTLMTFVGRYIEAVPLSCLVWANDEGDNDGSVIPAVLEEARGDTLVTMHDLYPSKEALDDAIVSGSTSVWGDQPQQLETLLADLGTSAEDARSSLGPESSLYVSEVGGCRCP